MKVSVFSAVKRARCAAIQNNIKNISVPSTILDRNCCRYFSNVEAGNKMKLFAVCLLFNAGNADPINVASPARNIRKYKEYYF